MARIPELATSKRVMETQLSPGGQGWGAARSGANALARGVQDMARALEVTAEQARIVDRQKAEMAYQSSAQGIVDLAKRAEGSYATSAAEKANEDLDKLRSKTLDNAWGSSANELSLATGKINLQSQAILMGHVREQQKVADRDVAAAGVAQSNVVMARVAPAAIAPIAVNQADENLNRRIELYRSRTGNDMPAENKALIHKALVGEFALNGFIQGFSDNPVATMDVWEADKDKLRGTMDVKNYAALQKKAAKHLHQVDFIKLDAEMKGKFTDPDTGKIDNRAAADWLLDPQNIDSAEYKHLTYSDRVQLSGAYEGAYNREVRQQAVQKEADRQSLMMAAWEMAHSESPEDITTMINAPGTKDILSASDLSIIERQQKEGMWTEDQEFNAQWSILNGDWKDTASIMSNTNPNSSSPSFYNNLLVRASGKEDPHKAAGNPNYFGQVNSVFMQEVDYAAGGSASKRRELRSKWFRPVQREILRRYRAADISPYSPEMQDIVYDVIGSFDKYIEKDGEFEKAGAIANFFGQSETMPSGLAEKGKAQPQQQEEFSDEDISATAMEGSEAEAVQAMVEKYGADPEMAKQLVQELRGE
ncbi:MAG: hypothetical protein DRP45_00960 [Candidatus Zixiibacteriota bacterium]|nr:MAG: hypothetical protein DRP45_00960 [candidate division Zixibacteria bacterium]